MIGYIDDTMATIENRDLGEQVAKKLWPYSLVHGDYHGSNMMIKEDGSGNTKTPLEAVVLDFQLVQISEPVADLGKMLLICLSPEDRRKCEKRLVRKNYDALVAAGMDSKTMPFDLYFLRYAFQGAMSWMLICGVMDTLMADGKDDEYLVAMIYERLAAFCEDHGNPAEIGAKTVEWRERLLKEAAAWK